MPQPRPPPPRASAQPLPIDPPRSVDTTQRENGKPNQAPKLPHERDESVDMTHGAPSEAMQQAHADLERGLQDTDARDASGRPLHQKTNAPRAKPPGK